MKYRCYNYRMFYNGEWNIRQYTHKNFNNNKYNLLEM